jgi:hypothetical protein
LVKAVVVVVAALTSLTCAHPGPKSTVVDDSWIDDIDEQHPLNGYEASFVLTWNGTRIGDAVEQLHTSDDDDMKFSRAERVIVKRGEVSMYATTVITIDTNRALDAKRVAIRQQTGEVVITGSAVRDSNDDWIVRYGDEPATQVDGAVIPAELAPLLVAASEDRRLEARVMMPGYGFAIGDLTIEPVAGSHGRIVMATLDTGVAELRGRMTLKPDGTISRVIATDAVGSFRTTRDEIEQPFTPPEIVVSASIPIVDSVPEIGTLTLVIEPVSHAIPTQIPGQVVEAHGDGWRVELTAGNAPHVAADDTADATPDSYFGQIAARIVDESGATDARSEVIALARATDSLLVDDYGTSSANPRASLALGRGDCTTHATVFAALASARGIPTRLVTGFRVDEQRMVRHRWAVAAVGGSWMSVDPTYGEAPARPRLLGLATHGPTASELAVIDDAAFIGFTSAAARRP